MAVMDAQALINDPDGMAMLAEVFGVPSGAAAPDRRFPRETWMPAIRLEDRLGLGRDDGGDAVIRLPAHAD